MKKFYNFSYRPKIKGLIVSREKRRTEVGLVIVTVRECLRRSP